MNRFNKILLKLPDEEVYLKNTFADVVLRSVPGNKSQFFAKTKKGKEYEIGHESDIVIDALTQAEEITKKQYEEY